MELSDNLLMRQRRSRWAAWAAAGMWRFARAKPLGAAGGVIVVLLAMVAVFATAVAPYDPVETHYTHRVEAPSGAFLLGTDHFGRDVFSRVIYGARTSLFVAVLSVALGASLGGLLGLYSGFRGGRMDFVLQRLVDVVLAFPLLVLALAVMAGLGTSLRNVIIAMAIVLAPRAARVLRSSALAVREAEYVKAARAVGCSGARQLFVHVLPNCLAPYIVFSTISVGVVIIAEASLSFLGLGVPPPDPSWGSMLAQEGYKLMRSAPWVSIGPGIALSLAVFGVNLLGDAVRDVWDPRLRQ